MARKSTRYHCTACGHEELRWMGQCPRCRAWNTLEAFTVERETEGPRSLRGSAAADAPALTRITEVAQRELDRIPVEPPEFARILGGGIVPGSFLLLGGAPGVGKSTLLTQLAGDFARSGRRVVYLTAEESAAQVRARARRLGAEHEKLWLAEEPVLDRLLPTLLEDPPELLIVDSIQTVLSGEIESAAGLVSQIRTCGALLADFARVSGCAVLLIGHVTKDGDLAGPRILEHLVDTVLYFEPQDDGAVRMIRAFKNRFGRTGEIAVLEMGEEGLRPVRDASALFLAGRQEGETGSAVSCILSGTRPFLVELQALLVKTQYAAPTRVVTGIDSKRVAQLAAILESKTDLELAKFDVYVKVAGGLRVTDPATDLAVAVAMASSKLGQPLPADLLVLGEVGLTGELRGLRQVSARLEEARAHGFRRALIASHSANELPAPRGMEVRAVTQLREAARAAFTWGAKRQRTGRGT
jgi:DNA repair protein RadA/Sms